MGWLRDLMGAMAPPIDGYGELARRALAHPEWPADTQPQARSLAALFSKLDRGIEIEWLADRDAAQRASAHWKQALAEYETPHLDDAVDEELREWIERKKASFPDSNV